MKYLVEISTSLPWDELEAELNILCGIEDIKFKRAIAEEQEEFDELVLEKIITEAFDSWTPLTDREVEFLKQNIKDLKVFVKNGQKLQAVKYIKDRLGWGLKESKDLMDRIFDTVDHTFIRKI